MVSRQGGSPRDSNVEVMDDYDEEQVMADRSYTVGDGSPDKSAKDMYNEEEYLAEVGELNCYCVPSRVYGFKDFFFRTLAWFLLNKEQILGGFTVAITQIPEAVTAAIIAGINPARALQATWIMNVLTSVIGGRPGMMSGSTAFIGVALMGLVDNHGPDYIFYAVMLGGFFQMLFGLMGLGALMRFVPYTVIQGFSNAMALVIFAAQFRYGKVSTDQSFRENYSYGRDLVDIGHSWAHIIDSESSWITGSSLLILGIHAAVAFIICLVMPRFTRIIPSSFVAIVFCTFLEHVLIRLPSSYKYESATIEDYAFVQSPTLRPIWTDVTINAPEFSFDTFKKIYLYALAVFGTGLAESLLTTQIVDELTEVKGMKNRVSFGQGFANVFVACFGGMGGSGSIAQSIVANHSDGITGLCTFLAGAFILLFIYAAYDAVTLVPLGCIGGIMSWTAFKLIDLESLLQAIAALLPLRVRDKINLDCKTPRADSLVMVAVMAFTICIDLSIGLLAGVFISAFVYVWDSSTRVIVEREVSAEESASVTYNVTGPLFFATAGGFSDIFPLEEIQFDPDEIVLLLENAEVYDYSGMVALKKVYDRFADLGKVVALSSLTPSSRRLMEKSAYMWQGVNFLEVEEVDQSVDMTASIQK